MTDLIFSLPLSEADYKHTKGFVHSPEPMTNAWLDQELIVRGWPIYFVIELQISSIIQKMEELCPNSMRVQTCPMTRHYMREVY